MDAATTESVSPVAARAEVPEDLRRRSIAITSGKGGVGKTSTAVNLALYFAGIGKRTALLDLDPLADVTAFLDMSSAESALSAREVRANTPLSDYRKPVYEKLDVLFPAVKLSRGVSSRLRSLLIHDYAQELLEHYDVFILDLPAGNEEETNLAFVDLTDTILLVTNPEPTAHMSAGGWCRALFESRPDRSVHIWHNRFARSGFDGFNPRTVIQNYNRNSPEELQISAERAQQISDLAWVPEDPALNMLRTGLPDPLGIALRSMEQLCGQIGAERANELLEADRMKPALRRFTVEVLSRDHAPDEETRELVSEVELLAVDTLGSEIGARVSTLSSLMRGDASLTLLGPEKRERVSRAIERVRTDDIWKDAARARMRCASAGSAVADGSRFLAEKNSNSREQTLRLADDSVRSLLLTVAPAQGAVRRNSQVLLFYLAFFKLIRHESIVKRVKAVIPRRRERGKGYRDRRRQISYLVEGDESFRSQYVSLVRALFPVVSQQITKLAHAVSGESLLIRRGGRIEKRAYLTLFSNALHDCLFSGLGVFTGFRYREASRAFGEAAERLAETLNAEENGQNGQNKKTE